MTENHDFAALLTTTSLEDPPNFPMPRAEGCPFDPPPTGKELQEQGPITRVKLWDGSTPWFVTRYAEGRALLADPRISSDVTRPGYPSTSARPQSGGSSVSFILMDDPEHARLRRMVTAPFTVRRIEALRPVVQRLTDELLEEMVSKPGPVDLVTEFALPLPSLVICELLGVPYRDHDFFQQQSQTVILRTSTPEDRMEAMGALTKYLVELVQHKIEDPGEDLLSDLARRVTAEELTLVEAAQIGILLLIAGHETTANMISLGTLALLEHPEELAHLREDPEPELVTSAVEELLRYLTITHDGRKRVATEDVEIGGVTIGAGDGVVIASDLGNRDADMFADPDRLDLKRNARRHIAFGFGVHQCLGQQLARIELQVVYGSLFSRLPGLKLATTLDQLPFKHDGSVYGLYELPVTW